MSAACPALLGFCLVAGVAPSAGETPEPEPGSVLILSVPSGLKAYFGPETDDAGPNEDGWVDLVENHPIIAETNLKGVTPVLIRDVKPGSYLLGIAPILIRDKRSHKETDPTLDARAFVSATKPPLPGQPFKEIKGAAVYSLRRESTAAQRVIVLAVRNDASLGALPNPGA